MQGAPDHTRQERARDAKQNRDDKAARISARHKKLGDDADEETDKDCPEYCHNDDDATSGASACS